MTSVPAQEPQPPNAFLQFVRTSAADLRAHDAAPLTLHDWQLRHATLQSKLERAWGGFPSEQVPLEPRIPGTLQRDGYRVEKIVFQTLPGIYMTANAYVPEAAGRRPAVLCVHGHWSGAKQDPHVQSRCIGLAKLGFFVLAVDAMGAGERGLGKALGEYHGEMVGATLWPIGRPLSGLQVCENRRAVDYLLTRPEVDGDRLGITGASGGGNQTMYAGALDVRFKAVVPVCSVGNYPAYLGAACCMCEVVPGALQFTDEWGVLSLTAPRALMVVSATRDAFQFSVGEARKSLAFVQPIYELYGKPSGVRHAVFESPHDYNRQMREAMYGWMTLHLKEEGDGSPIAEPDMQTEDPETLRCFPGETRPDNWMTIPMFAAREAEALIANIELPRNEAAWQKKAQHLREQLDRKVLGGTQPLARESAPAAENKHGSLAGTVPVEPGINLTTTKVVGKEPRRPQTVVVLAFDDTTQPQAAELVAAVSESGRDVITITLRATGADACPADKIGRAPDHNSAEWSLWLGRPLLGQWVMDVRTLMDTVAADSDTGYSVTVIGLGPAGVVALCAAAIDSRIDHVMSVMALSSYKTALPYEGQRLGLMANGILRDVGDIPHIAALVAPRRLTIAGAVAANRHRLSLAELDSQFAYSQHVYKLTDAAQAVSVREDLSVAAIVTALDD